MLGPVGLGMRAVAGFAANPIQTARGVLQVACFTSVASWIGFGFYGWWLAKTHGEPQAERIYNTCGESAPTQEGAHDNSGGGGEAIPATETPSSNVPETTAGDMADTGGSLDNWITDGLIYAGYPDSQANHQAMYAQIMGESSGNELALQNCNPPNDDENCFRAPNAPGTGFSDNRARGLTQMTPDTWYDWAPSELQPASAWIFKPRASVAASVTYQMGHYGYLKGHSGY